MHQRQSVRRYTGEPIPEDVIEQMLECATRAPSAQNCQPWRFTVLREEVANRLARAMGAKLRRDRLADGDNAGVVENDVARSFQRITGAPVVVLVSSSLRDMGDYPDPGRRAAEAAMALQSTAVGGAELAAGRERRRTWRLLLPRMEGWGDKRHALSRF